MISTFLVTNSDIGRSFSLFGVVQSPYFSFLTASVYFWLPWVFTAYTQAFSHCGEWGLLSSCGTQASHFSDFSCCRAWSLGTWASVAVARGLRSCSSPALEHRLNSCGPWILLLHGMWDSPGPGIETVSPASAGGFLTT